MKYQMEIAFNGSALIDVYSDDPEDAPEVGINQFWYMFKQAKPFADLDIEIIDYDIYEM